MDRKRTRGRQKIPIQKITNDGDRFATFSKRRVGLYKKASETSTLCNLDIGIIVSSPTGKPFSFFHPTMESVLGRVPNFNFQHDEDVSRLTEAYTRNRISQLNGMYDNYNDQLEVAKKRGKMLAESRASREKHWWDVPIADMHKEQVQKYMIMLKDLQLKLKIRADEVKRHAALTSRFSEQYVQNPSNSMVIFNPLSAATQGAFPMFSTVNHFSTSTSVHASQGYYLYGQNQIGETSGYNQIGDYNGFGI